MIFVLTDLIFLAKSAFAVYSYPMKRPSRHKPDPRAIYRYDNGHHRFLIDIARDYYRDLYNEWDYAPFKNRALDKGLLGYLEECCREIPDDNSLGIVFHLPAAIRNQVREERSVLGLRNYFRYTLQKKHVRLRQYRLNTARYVGSGLVFLFIAYLLQQFAHVWFMLNVLPQGLYIGGWVLFWRRFRLFFSNMGALRREIAIYDRLAQAHIVYEYDEKK